MTKPFAHQSWADILAWILPWTPEDAHPRLAPLARVVELHAEFGADGLHTFFFLDGSDGAPTKAPQIASALKALGLAREHALFERALALFPQPYAESHDARAGLFGYTFGDRLNAFDRHLMAISDAFGPREALEEAITSLIAADPALEAALVAACAQAPAHIRDELRFYELAAMTSRLDIDLLATPDAVARRLGQLDEPRRHVAALVAFVFQFENGGVHQFFYNAEGSIAPEVCAALEAAGLPQQAGFMRQALAMFGLRYARDTQERRARHFDDREWNDWDEALADVTNRFYDLPEGPGLRPALLDYARRTGVLRD